MSEEQLEQSAHSKIGDHRLVILIIGAILVSLMLVTISMAMYSDSPASQLDLSKPGLKAIRAKTEQFDNFKEFSETGPVDKDTLDEFQKLYDKQAHEASGFDAFAGDALSDQTLHIDSPDQADTTQNQ